MKEPIMTLRCTLRRLLLSPILVVVAACVSPTNPDSDIETTSSVAAPAATDTASRVSPATEQDSPLEANSVDAYRHGCGRGVAKCSPEQVGQQCDPNHPLNLCVAQTSGAFCCLPVAQ
jgi:hypothetical protein